jgi:hypothetical protein
VAREHAPVFRADAMGLWFITRYEDVTIALRDTETFSSQMAGETLADGVPASLRPELDRALAGGVPDDSRFLAITDAPSHNVRRKLAQQAFTPRRVAALERLIQARTEELCDGFGPAERVDLMSAFTYPLTTSVIAGIIGLEEEHAAQMRAVSEDLLVVNSPGGRQLDQAEAEDVIARIARISRLHTDIAHELAARREAPRDDLLSALATSTLNDGTRLEDEDILAITAELILAGTDTTANLIAHAVLYLSPDHERWRQLAGDDDLTHAVVEETLRRRGSSKGLFRITTRDPQSPRNRPTRRLRPRHPLLPRRSTGAAGNPSRAPNTEPPLPRTGGSTPGAHLHPRDEHPHPGHAHNHHAIGRPISAARRHEQTRLSLLSRRSLSTTTRFGGERIRRIARVGSGPIRAMKASARYGSIRQEAALSRVRQTVRDTSQSCGSGSKWITRPRLTARAAGLT